MLLCDWCRQPIEGEPDATLSLVFKSERPNVRSGLHFHEGCGVMALYRATEEIEDHMGGERPDPASEELLEHIPTVRGSVVPGANPDGRLTDALRLVEHLGESKATYTLYDVGIKTLLDASFRTRAEVAAIDGIGRSALGRLETATRSRRLGLCVRLRRRAAHRGAMGQGRRCLMARVGDWWRRVLVEIRKPNSWLSTPWFVKLAMPRDTDEDKPSADEGARDPE